MPFIDAFLLCFCGVSLPSADIEYRYLVPILVLILVPILVLILVLVLVPIAINTLGRGRLSP
ncbi:MAG: hypothetical protein ACRC47_14140 [Shewanella sp.]